MLMTLAADIRSVRVLLITLFHLVVIVISLTLAFWLRYDFVLAGLDTELLLSGLAVAVPVKLLVFFLGALHKGWWRYAGLSDLVRVFLVNLAASLLTTAGIVFRVSPEFPDSVFAIDFLLCFLICAGARFSVRLYNETLRAEFASEGRPVLIYGAGSAGRTLLREIRANPGLGYQVIGFVDDNPALVSTRIMDVPVLGSGRGIASIVDRYRSRGQNIDELIIAMPSASGRQMREAHANCRAAGLLCKTIPGIGDLLRGNYLTAQLRNISLEDLLGREPIRLDEERIQGSIEGRSILITGAAGSIGSELGRQTARFRPARLVLLDQAESDLFRIEQELRHLHPGLDIVPVVADIRDLRSLEKTILTHSIQSIYHAAAYKHVPMMELHVVEAVRNNVIGTWNLVQAARKHKVSNFLMISSDKAVNPTSVMGATKRVAELIVAAEANGRGAGTRFVSVRFGNVLGSNGSVVPTFQAQIAAGGPVTVTHPEVRRYFMSLREAVLLVLQASTMGKKTEIFVLDMGEPIRILDLAHNMIRLAGLVPDDDIEVRITGLRPGEKLYEEIMLDDENVMPTYHDKIRIFTGQTLEPEQLSRSIELLQLLIDEGDSEKIRGLLASLVPEYKPESARVFESRESIRAVKPESQRSSTAGTTA